MDKKTCTRCGVEKPLCEFYPRKKGMARRPECKACGVRLNQGRRPRSQDPKNRAYHRAYERLPHILKQRYARRKRLAQTPAWKQRIQARNAVRYAKKKGRLKAAEACQLCGFKCQVQAHHWKGYSPEHWLDVLWLCPECHKQADRDQKLS